MVALYAAPTILRNNAYSIAFSSISDGMCFGCISMEKWVKSANYNMAAMKKNAET